MRSKVGLSFFMMTSFKSNRKWHWWLVTALILLCVRRQPANAADIWGVYALGDPGHPTPEDVLDNPDVDGVALRFPWQAIEHSPGRYNWGFIDNEIQRIAAHGKRVSLTIAPGRFTPPWVLGQGVRLYSFQWRLRGEGPCRDITIPVPWDPVYMSNWQSFVRAAGAHFDTNPALVSVKMQGVQSNTPELILPKSGPWGGCPYSDRNANWQRVGYTRSRVIATWQTYAQTYAASFPHKGLVLEIVPDGLPPIDDTGRLMSVRADNAGVEQIAELAIRTLGPQLIIQNDGISAMWNWDFLAGLGNRVTVGYQTVWASTGDPQCRMGGYQSSSCDPAMTLRATVDRATRAGASYMEIYETDIENPALREIVADAHRRLSPRNRL